MWSLIKPVLDKLVVVVVVVVVAVVVVVVVVVVVDVELVWVYPLSILRKLCLE